MKIISIFAFVSLLSLGGCASDLPSCSPTCDKIFKECGLSSFGTPGGTATASNCVSLCEQGQKGAPAQVEEIVSCIETTSCNQLSTCEQ